MTPPLAPCIPLCYSSPVETKKDVLILKVSGNKVDGVIDPVAVELPITIVLNNTPLVTLLCTPAELTELAVGFLLSEGILTNRASLQKIEVSEEEATVRADITNLPPDFNQMLEKQTIASGCGRGITFTHAQSKTDHKIPVLEHMVSLDDIKKLLHIFRTISKLYLETGGVHSAALSDGKGVLSFSEDVGRHNAVDKLIGKAFLQSVPVENHILLTSGRVTSEIMNKAARNRFPILISRAAPSCMAVNYAEDMGITLVGFARGDRMNIYTWPKRIKMT
jgi:FdhD protein